LKAPTGMSDVATRVGGIAVSAFLLFGVLVLGWSAGQLLVSVWLQTLVLWALVALGGLALVARAHRGVFLVALPLGGFVAFVTANFINFFGMFAWAAWADEQGTGVRMVSFNPFINSWHFLQRAPEVMSGWQITVLVALQVGWILPTLVGSRERMALGVKRLFENFTKTIMVNHVALLIGVFLAVVFSGSNALLVGLLGLLLLIDCVRLMTSLLTKARGPE
jgi:hypothetical protein